jgi:hypothetical protein
VLGVDKEISSQIRIAGNNRELVHISNAFASQEQVINEVVATRNERKCDDINECPGVKVYMMRTNYLNAVDFLVKTRYAASAIISGFLK